LHLEKTPPLDYRVCHQAFVDSVKNNNSEKLAAIGMRLKDVLGLRGCPDFMKDGAIDPTAAQCAEKLLGKLIPHYKSVVANENHRKGYYGVDRNHLRVDRTVCSSDSSVSEVVNVLPNKEIRVVWPKAEDSRHGVDWVKCFDMEDVEQLVRSTLRNISLCPGLATPEQCVQALVGYADTGRGEAQ
jgi:hypothetical protein